VLTDEIYEHLTYDDHRFSSMPVLVPELADRCVVVNGVARTYASALERDYRRPPLDAVRCR
jgi:aspartate/methionine/tyrosine aminotransferase